MNQPKLNWQMGEWEEGKLPTVYECTELFETFKVVIEYTEASQIGKMTFELLNAPVWLETQYFFDVKDMLDLQLKAEEHLKNKFQAILERLV